MVQKKMIFTSNAESELLAMPDLPFLVERIQTKLRDEKKDRAEFRSALTEDSKSEFINGQILMHSPAADDHNDAVMQLGSAANIYSTIKKIGKVRVEKALVGLTRNDYEPDIAFWRKEIADGFAPAMNVYPLPDLVVEVLSPGKLNEKRDREIKFVDYAVHGIGEYWIVDPRKRTVEQYLLSETEPKAYELFKKATVSDHIESTVMTGFALPVRAIFEAEANAEAIARLIGG